MGRIAGESRAAIAVQLGEVWRIPSRSSTDACNCTLCGIPGTPPGNEATQLNLRINVKQSIEQLARDLMDGKDVNLVQRTCDICRHSVKEKDTSAEAPLKIAGAAA